MTSLQAFKTEIERRDRETTPGPWSNRAIGYEVESPTGTVCQMMTSTSYERDNDAGFIAYSRTALPKLLALAEDLQAERDERASVAEKYATAARVIALHLKAFCNEKLSYDEMIADAARKASARIAAQAETLRVVEIDMERIKSLNKTSGVLNPSMTMCASEEIASSALAEIRREG